MSKWVELSDLDVEGLSAYPPHPLAIRFFDQSERNLESWKDLLFQTANWLVDSGWLAPSDVPVMVPSGRTRYIINYNPTHVNGRDFDEPMGITRVGLWVETMVDRKQAKAHALALLEACGIPPLSVEVLVTEGYESPEHGRLTAERSSAESEGGGKACGCACLIVAIALIVILCMTCLGGDDGVREECRTIASETAMTQEECEQVYDLWPG